MQFPRFKRSRPGAPQPRTDSPLPVYLARAAWVALGVILLATAHWPPSCSPQNFLDVVGAYRCSIRLTNQRGWADAALLTWLWATPILASMVPLRWLRR